MNKNNKKNLLFTVIGAITLIVVTLGATYAYFVAQSGGGANIDTNVITGTTDNLSFSFGDLINIQATEENFGQGMGSISDSTTGQAILKANNTTNEATARYNIYLIIESNDFVYTTEEQTPEIVLNVTDPNGNLVENITGLVHYENGFDITTRTGGFLLAPDYEITATESQTIQDWNIEVTLVNLNSDQNENTNKTLSGRLYITQDQMSSYELTQINNIDATTTYNSIDATLDLTSGSAPVSKYYYGIEKVNNTRSAETVEYIESDNPNYKFSNLEANTEYTIYSYVVDENKIKSNVYETNVTTAEYQIPTVDTVGHSVTLNSISLTVNASNGSNEIVKYMYSKDNGNSWEESTSNTHTFNNLTDSTEYKIKVKVVDSEGLESTEYYEAITTEIYILPVVASVNATTTWNSITLTPTGTNGTNTIDHYEYSINNGAYQESNVFSNLTDNTNYTIRVKAIDTAGRESNVYETTVRTDAYRLPTISVTTSSTTNSITINVNATPGDGSIVSYHYSRDDGSNYTTTSSNSYTFNGLTGNTTYYLKIYVTDSNGRTSTFYSTNITTKSAILAEYIINEVYTGVDGENGLYYHDGQGTYTNADQEAGDNSYRYAGANPNNYVCFGSDEESCPADNLYRIIGVFENQVKLIKNASIGDYVWDVDNIDFGSLVNVSNTNSDKFIAAVQLGEILAAPTPGNPGSNNWEEADINYYINNDYLLNKLENKWQSKIATMSWQVGGNTYNNIAYQNAPTAYQNEIINPSLNTTYSAKIGLMYVSDYMYGSDPIYWTFVGYNSNGNDYRVAINDNWLYLGDSEWTISRNSDVDLLAFYVSNSGFVNHGGTNSDEYAIRPVFYLESPVVLESGTGTQENPYRIAI